jgi:hypothetical protein
VLSWTAMAPKRRTRSQNNNREREAMLLSRIDIAARADFTFPLIARMKARSDV